LFLLFQGLSLSPWLSVSPDCSRLGLSNFGRSCLGCSRLGCSYPDCPRPAVPVLVFFVINVLITIICSMTGSAGIDGIIPAAV
jgi:hypothetical protein